jgi:hypothetical protein
LVDEHDETPDTDALVDEIVASGYFGAADADDVRSVLAAATAYSQGYLLLSAGDVPRPAGIAWATSGYLECDHVQICATHESEASAAHELLRAIQESRQEGGAES